jgi:hypothetical protein
MELDHEPGAGCLGPSARRLRGRSESSAWVTVFTTEDERASASSLLAGFMSDMLDSIDSALRIGST